MDQVNKVLILGNGGMARAMLDLLQFCGKLHVKGFLWEDGDELCGLPIVNRIEAVNSDIGLVLGMMFPQHRIDNVHKWGIERFVRILDGNISDNAVVEQGAAVVKDAYVMSMAKIEKFAHLHTHSIVGHDCVVGAYSFIGPGVILGGRSKIGTCCRIGMGARVLPDVVLEDNVTVAAGSFVTKNVKENMTVFGNPAKPIFRTIKGRF